jgi:hypothetical protein
MQSAKQIIAVESAVKAVWYQTEAGASTSAWELIAGVAALSQS